MVGVETCQSQLTISCGLEMAGWLVDMMAKQVSGWLEDQSEAAGVWWDHKVGYLVRVSVRETERLYRVWSAV